jgi:hypothetical protein
MDTFVTSPEVTPGNWDVTFHVRTRQNGSKNGAGACSWEIDAELLRSTSGLLRRLLVKDPHKIYIVWRDLNIVESYVDYLYDRKIHRIPENVKSTHYQWTVLKYPKQPLTKYSPLFRDMHMLINLWLFGCYLQDVVFMDTVMSYLEELLKELLEWEYADGDDARELFIRFMKNPSVVNAIWTHTASGAKLRAFVIDTVLTYGSHIDLLGIISAKADVQDSGITAAPTPSTNARQARGESALPPRSSRRNNVSANLTGADFGGDNAPMDEDKPHAYAADFLAELNAAARGTLLVSQLPMHIQSFYPGQVRVFLPPLPYTFGEHKLIHEPAWYTYQPHTPDREEEVVYGPAKWSYTEPVSIVSVHQLQGPFRDGFFEAVYGEGRTVLRSTYWDAEREPPYGGDSVGGQDVEMMDVDVDGGSSNEAQHVKMSCVYHEHAEDGACWLLGKRFRRGVPVGTRSLPANS